MDRRFDPELSKKKPRITFDGNFEKSEAASSTNEQAEDIFSQPETTEDPEIKDLFDNTPIPKDPVIRKIEIPDEKPKPKKPAKKLSTKVLRIIIIAVATIAVVLSMVFIISRTILPVRIPMIETVKTLITKDKNAPVQSVFNKNDPIMVRFEFDNAKVGSVIDFEVEDKRGVIIKSGTTMVLRQTSDDPEKGLRSILISDNSSKALPVGYYTVYLLVEDNVIRTIEFEITE